MHVRLYKSSLSTRVYYCDDDDHNNSSSSGGGSSNNNNNNNKAKKNAYRAIDLTNLPSEILASHVNYFLEPLYCAERCWASSLALKAEMNRVVIDNNNNNNNNTALLGGEGLNNPRKDWSAGKFRAQSMKRLKKAVKYASLVETLALSTTTTTTTKTAPSSSSTEESANDEIDDDDDNDDDDAMKNKEGVLQPPVDEHTQMEARAYASFMRGNLALEMNQWQTACTEYQLALKLCEALAQGLVAGTTTTTTTTGSSSGGDDDDEVDVDVQQLELFDFFTSRAKNVIAPLLKYCHYELQVSLRFMLHPFIFPEISLSPPNHPD